MTVVISSGARSSGPACAGRATRAEPGADAGPAAARSGAALDALTLRLDGTAAAATTIRRKRSVPGNVLGYASELEELSANPLDRVKWKPPKVAEVVDHRVVGNPRQARELLTAVTYVGRPWRGRVNGQGRSLACGVFAASGRRCRGPVTR
jgi:hypothetical protein